MTSFFSIEQYSPLAVLGVGLSTFVGLWGLGTALLFLVRLKLPSPWQQLAALMLGIQTLSLAVQFTGTLEIASRSVLIMIWFSLLAIGGVALLTRCESICISRLSIGWWRTQCRSPATLPLTIVAAALVTNLLVALAPSTKIDELYYHMLIPSRIVSDGALRFYREPWEGAISSQMIFQISAAPAHALGYPDSTNVVSWALSGTLLWFAWRISREGANTLPWTALCVAALSVGLYPAVFHVTGGAHALGDLALAAAVVAFCKRECLLATVSSWAYAALLSILLLSASTSKISLLPLCVILLCFAVLPLLKGALPRDCLRIAFAAAIPWIVFYCPIVCWTWTHSGSPFGPILASMFESSVYSSTWLEQTFQATRDANRQPSYLIQNAVLGYSPLIWLGVVWVILRTDLNKIQRIILFSLFGLQCLLIYWFLPYDVRFLSLYYGLFIIFALQTPPAMQERLTSVRMTSAACVMFILPWLALQIYYAEQFFPVSLGLEKAAFYNRHIAFYSDYVTLNNLLAEDAVLLSPHVRVSAVYAPRPIFFDRGDLPQGRPAVLFMLKETAGAGTRFNGYKIGRQVYLNGHAVIRTYRTPGRSPEIGPLDVVTLISD